VALRQRRGLKLARPIPGHPDYMIDGVRYVPLDDLKRAEKQVMERGNALFSIRNLCMNTTLHDGRMLRIYALAVKGLTGKEPK
jgi:hypothetical protein